jgi:Tol biopolymer transport system component
MSERWDARQVPDVWVYDISRDLRTRLTFDPRWDLGGAWSPGGRELVFSSYRRGHADLYRKPVEGSGEAEPLLVSEKDKMGPAFSPDGRLIVFQQTAPTTSTDLWILPLHGDGEPRPFLETEFNESTGVFSPDGRWMAYVSDESGRGEVYVTAFPVPGQKQRVSTEGGMRPQWRGDGRELFYRGLDGSLVAVEVDAAGEGLVIGRTERLFQMPPGPSQAPTYSAMPDGQRFLVVTPRGTDASNPLAVVLNWPRLLNE